MTAHTARNTSASDTAPERSLSRIATRRSDLVADTTGGTPAAIWEPEVAATSAVPTTDEVLHCRPPCGALPAIIERAIIAALTRPLRADENHLIGNENRERELEGLFATLEPVQALELRCRLDADRNDDPLTIAFRRIVAERRRRLRAFLANARRRLGSRNEAPR